MKLDVNKWFCLGFFCFLMACNGRDEVRKLQLETEAIHDDAMKDLAELNRITRALGKELAVLDSLKNDSIRRDSIVLVLTEMKLAEEDMMQWMSEYVAPGDKMPKEEALTYLTKQKDFISQNAEDIKKAILLGKKMKK